MIKNYWMFEDKAEDLEFSKQGDAIRYKAWGVVSCIQYPEDREDGNVIGVIYRSPSGRLFRRWRQAHEVDLHEMEAEEWKRVHNLLLFAGDEASKKPSEPPQMTRNPESKFLH